MNKTRNIPGVLLVVLLITVLFTSCTNDFEDNKTKSETSNSSLNGVHGFFDALENEEASREHLTEGFMVIYEVIEKEGNSEDMVKEMLSMAQSMIRRRLEWLDLTEATVEETDESCIVVEIPEVDDPDEIFHRVSQMGSIVFETSSGEAVLDNSDILEARAESGDIDGTGTDYDYIVFTLTSDGLKKFGEATEKMANLQYNIDADGNYLNYITIKLDDEEISKPYVTQKITENPIMTVSSYEEATWLADIINTGNMPFRLRISSKS